ncbi:hypothetical protein [Thermogemmatispora sp.]|uniref:hypothetical protein n=1 Tax=Thermogemmatispora sp. TaxID=1968838 RepID=UPI0035E3FF01
MQIDDVHALLTESAQQDLVQMATMIAPGVLTLLQVEPEDSIKTVLAGISQQQRPVILTLPQGPLPSWIEHVAQLQLVQSPPIVGIVASGGRMETLAHFADRYGIALFPSLEQAIASWALPPSTALQDESSGGTASPKHSVNVLLTHPEAELPTPPSASEFNLDQDQEPGESEMGNTGGPLSLESWGFADQTPLAEKTHTNQRHDGQRTARGSVSLRQRAKLALLVFIGVILMALMLILSLVLEAIPSTRFTEPTVPTFVGTVSFSNSSQLDPLGRRGLNDVITLDLYSLPAVPTGKVDDLWLLPDQADDQTAPLLLGRLSAGSRREGIHLTYSSPHHTNLLAQYSRLLVTEEDATSHPITPALDSSTWRVLGAISDTPTPGDELHYSLLSHLRHLLAKDPELQQIGLSGGLSLWLYRNSEKLLEWSSAARDDWASGTHTALLRRQVIRVLDYLDGTAYVGQDTPSGTPILVDPKAGRIGLLDLAPTQVLPSYLAHISLHLSGLVNAPGHTGAQQYIATSVDKALQVVRLLMQHIRQDALQLVSMSDAQLRQEKALSLLNDMVINANTAYVGQQDPTTGRVQGE